MTVIIFDTDPESGTGFYDVLGNILSVVLPTGGTIAQQCPNTYEVIKQGEWRTVGLAEQDGCQVHLYQPAPKPGNPFVIGSPWHDIYEESVSGLMGC